MKPFALVAVITLLAMPIMAVELNIAVDATELPRRLVHSEIEMNATPGRMALYYPEWIPGIHGPRGPLQNLAQISVATPSGEAVSWERDPKNAFRFWVDVPEGAGRIVVKTTYIASQPSVNSRGVDTYGTAGIGAINWNTLFLYPDGPAASEIVCNVKLALPDGWQGASSLQVASLDGGGIGFEPVSFEELLDSPLICGPYLRTVDITPDGVDTPHYLEVASDNPQGVEVKPEIIEQLKRMVGQALEMTGRFPFDRYHLLVACSDNLPSSGLEHLRSSYNAVSERALIDMGEYKKRAAYLLPHEYAHAWCGKYKRPAGMITPDFNTPKDTRLLWVYEGLDQCMGYALTQRSGMSSYDEGLLRLANLVARHGAAKGRRAISLQDTAASAYQRRGGSEQWGLLNRSQDYYNEGLFLWMEIDATLRDETNGGVSLNHFLKAFFADTGAAPQGFARGDLTALLNQIHPHDWDAVIEKYTTALREELPLDFLAKAGYAIGYATEPNSLRKADESGGVDMRDSIGMIVSSGGAVSGIVPGGAADSVDIRPQSKVIGVNMLRFTPDRMRGALAKTVQSGALELLLLEDETFRTVTISYEGGSRYIKLIEDETHTNWLKEIWAFEEEG